MDAAQRLLSKRLLTTKEVAKILNMEPRTVRLLVVRNEIPFMRLNNWHLRFDPETIEAWMKEREGAQPHERRIWEGRRRALAERKAKVSTDSTQRVLGE